jgi:hypothetical protein
MYVIDSSFSCRVPQLRFRDLGDHEYALQIISTHRRIIEQ